MQIVVRNTKQGTEQTVEQHQILKEVVAIMMHSNLTITKIAEQAGCHAGTLNLWADGRTRCGRFDIMAKVLNVCGYDLVIVAKHTH